ncbi:MAG: hypothetical protein ACYDER_10235 [Ktedonobacteraceae bacterium]
MQTYTFGQCVRLLDVDPKVFRRWIKEDLGLQVSDQVSRADGRVRYLTREQLEQLAGLHEITLPTGGEQGKQEHISPGAYKLLADRLKAVENALRASELTVSSVQEEADQLLARLMQVEQQMGSMAQWTTSLEQLPASTSQIEARLARLEQTQEQADPRLTELEAQHRQQLAEAEARYQRQIDELEAELARYHQRGPTSSTTSVTAKKKASPAAKNFPKNLASRSAFAALHHIPDSVVARACNSGKIAVVSGKWLYKSRLIFQALGERGRQDFYHIFHTRPDFTPCKRCPHEITHE